MRERWGLTLWRWSVVALLVVVTWMDSILFSHDFLANGLPVRGDVLVVDLHSDSG